MGDAGRNKELQMREQNDISTQGSQRFVGSLDDKQLAKASFYSTHEGDVMKCFACGLEMKDSNMKSGDVDVAAFHKQKKPECDFAQKLPFAKYDRVKAFLSVHDRLRCEKARLDTFVDWPVTFLSPFELARDGFYFLRTSDHCACVFCKGIIGAWEKNDTARGEHQKHFPHCSFIKGSAVGNIPMAQCLILSKYIVTFFASAKMFDSRMTSNDFGSEDVTGLGRKSSEINSHSRLTQKVNGVSLKDIGLPEYRGPKHKHYVTYENRLASFQKWPERVKQQPCELAEAGFYSCGPSDHVRCFHCGNGICNWEKDDVPWEVHALWYPNCNFVLLTKGQEYVMKVRKRELCETEDNAQKLNLSESEVDCLMELDVMHSVRGLGFTEDAVRGALRKRIENTGVPFMNVDQCIEAIYAYAVYLKDTRKETETKIEKLSLSQASVNTNENGTTASSSSLQPRASTGTASSPVLPPSTDLASNLPLPQLTMQTTITSLPSSAIVQETRDTSEVPSASSVAGNVNNLVESASVQKQRQTLTSLPSRYDDSEEKINGKGLSQESSKLAAIERSRSSDELQEELDRARESMMCKVCMDAKMTVVFLPCSHMATCASCSSSLSICPVCRIEIKYAFKPIFS